MFSISIYNGGIPAAFTLQLNTIPTPSLHFLHYMHDMEVYLN